jgi:hypothetical protein
MAHLILAAGPTATPPTREAAMAGIRKKLAAGMSKQETPAV